MYVRTAKLLDSDLSLSVRVGHFFFFIFVVPCIVVLG